MVDVVPHLFMNIICQISFGKRVQEYDENQKEHILISSIKVFFDYLLPSNPENNVPVLQKLPFSKVCCFWVCLIEISLSFPAMVKAINEIRNYIRELLDQNKQNLNDLM